MHFNYFVHIIIAGFTDIDWFFYSWTTQYAYPHAISKQQICYA